MTQLDIEVIRSIYTDGSCFDNPGQGGWAAVVVPDPSSNQQPIVFAVDCFLLTFVSRSLQNHRCLSL
ncbi:hypothetical protein ACQ4M3_19260 [Leptolyngbya sp. AN03gr2]|uniref:hypothetical protein n=1 Tax=Leptolyngbya sp. AN03gr2 TaxID=3423364 RepID=UPI003D3220A1